MNNEFYELIDILGEKKATSFFSKTNDNIAVKTNISQVVRDTTWIDKMEEMIPYIDDIIRNPRKFIVQEEELKPVEKTKKVTEESIKHLAKHTSLIQDVDKDGNVMPLKLLNVYKEESTDLYENRFIHSLVVNVKVFLDDFVKNNNLKQKSNYVKEINYNSETVLNDEVVKIDLKIKNEYQDHGEEEIMNDSIKERVDKIIEIFNDFEASQFIKSLRNVMPVRSPIKKTNVILKDPNFKKAVELWEFIESYDITKSTEMVDSVKNEDPYDLAKKMQIGSYIEYNAIANVSKVEEDEEDYKLGIDYIRKAIEMYINESHDNEKAFKNMLTNEFRKLKTEQEKIYSEIKVELDNNIVNHNERIYRAISYLN